MISPIFRQVVPSISLRPSKMKIAKKHLLLASTCFGLASFGSQLAGAANLITNGDFSSTNLNLTNRQIGFSDGAVDGWVSGTIADPLTPAIRYNFIVGPGAADTTGVLTKYNTQLYFCGSNNTLGGGVIPNSSPDGGNYLALDGSFEVGPLSQQLSGLTIGDAYELSFYWAAAQQFGYDAPNGLTEKLQVTLGGQTISTPVINYAEHTFVDWQKVTMTFTADSVSPILSFLSVGTPDGLPPFVLLDGVSMIPEPSACLLGTFFLGGLALRRNRRSTQA
jgi:hypothetical protein